jgi:glycosyltransferase involved in cell wall biosynthesis
MTEKNNNPDSENPLVSFIVITYNSAKYVLETLESVKSQTYQNIEIIISDDASTDNTVEICKKWVKKNKDRFVWATVVTVQKNTGISANCNRGLYAAKGQWVKIIGGDDVLDKTYTKEMVSLAVSLSEEFGMIGSCYNYIDESGRLISKENPSKGINVNESKNLVKDFLDSNLDLETITLFIRLKAIKALGGFDESIFQEDLYMIYHMLKNFKLAFINQPLVYYRRHSQSVSKTNNSARIQESHILLWKKIYKNESDGIKRTIEKRLEDDVFSIYQLNGNIKLAIEGIDLVKSGPNWFRFFSILLYIKLGFPKKGIRLLFQPQRFIK